MDSFNAQSPIGLIDSGVGGLSVLLEITKVLPHQPLIYLADSAFCPYGSRPAQEIGQRVVHLADFLLSQGTQMLVLACNSATIAAVEILREIYPIPIIGMEPGVKPAVQQTRSGCIGILATEASLAGEKFHRLVAHHAQGVRVITAPCPDFVHLVEKGDIQSKQALLIVERNIDPLLKQGADVLVLGCTHYPFLAPLITEVAGKHVTLIQTQEAVGRQALRLLPFPAIGGVPTYRATSSGNLEHFKRLFAKLCPGVCCSFFDLDTRYKTLSLP